MVSDIDRPFDDVADDCALRSRQVGQQVEQVRAEGTHRQINEVARPLEADDDDSGEHVDVKTIARRKVEMVLAPITLDGQCSSYPAASTVGTDPAFGSGPLATVVQDLLSLTIYFAIATLIVL